MTDTISDESRKLERKLYLIHNGVDNSVEAERIIQSALTAARANERKKTLEDVINKCEKLVPSVIHPYRGGAEQLLDEIRAMKVQL